MMGYIPEETTSFEGRQEELARLDTALATHRLVTLTGAGGVGKTRIAQRSAARTAQRAAPRFPDGVWWADLSALENAELLLATVSDAVDLSDHSPRMPVEALCEWLADKRLLLVLDSCEHLVEECAHLVGELLTSAPGLTVLTTSRRPLNLVGEELTEVGPLDGDGADALALFTRRVTDSDPDALAGPGAARAAAEICRRLEGIPLALELAAAQVGPSTVEDVSSRLGFRFDVLARADFVWPPRHRTLRTTIGWSHELCAPVERLLWARLTVFRGSFDLTAARAVTSGGPLAEHAVAATLERLVAQSVVRRDGHRYRMLDTIREYGQEWLRELGEEHALADRHAGHFLELARRADALWSSSEQARCYRQIDDVHTDLRTALDHLLATEPARAAELAGLLCFFWTCCGHLKEARGYLERALMAHDTQGPERTRALCALGVTITLQGDYPSALQVSELATRAAAYDGDKEAQFAAAYLSGLLALLTGRAEDARDTVDAALAAVPGWAFDSPSRLRCHLVAVFALTGLGRLPEARARARELRQHCAQLGEVWTLSYLEYQLALIALFQSAPHEAAGHARTMLESKRLLGDAFGIALGLDLLAAALAAEGRGEQAATVYGVGESYWRSVGHPQRGTPELRGVREQCEATARALVGDAAYDRAYRRGATEYGRTALAAALAEEPPAQR
ncbi:ATP-binding protein [Streptomyces sp. NPDC008079]|uniref:ATP-binding protein n=1 Tax=unclassified Streptomyces TaxID=2593676 RepID=UPI0036E7E95F